MLAKRMAEKLAPLPMDRGYLALMAAKQDAKSEKLPYSVAVIIGIAIFLAGLLMMFYSETSGGGYILLEGANGELISYPRMTVTEYPLAGLGILLMPIGLCMAFISVILYNMKRNK